MGELFLFRKLVFLSWMPLIKTNDVSLVLRLSQQLRKSSPSYRLERAETCWGLLVDSQQGEYSSPSAQVPLGWSLRCRSVVEHLSMKMGLKTHTPNNTKFRFAVPSESRSSHFLMKLNHTL